MNPTDQQLQLALAKELPELIEIEYHTDNAGSYSLFIWRIDCKSKNPEELRGHEVTSREWDWVVRECEKKLTSEQDRMSCVNHSYDLNEGVQCYHQDYWATWQQRAIAYFKTIGKEVA